MISTYRPVVSDNTTNLFDVWLHWEIIYFYCYTVMHTHCNNFKDAFLAIHAVIYCLSEAIQRLWKACTCNDMLAAIVYNYSAAFTDLNNGVDLRLNRFLYTCNALTMATTGSNTVKTACCVVLTKDESYLVPCHREKQKEGTKYYYD